MLTLAVYFCVKLGLLQLYPAYICYKALKVNNQQEFGSLLTFWIVSISYLAVEYFSDMFLFWIPFYTEIKLVIVLWLILPQTQGASVFYTKYLDPFLHSHEQHIDNALLEIQAKLKETILLYGKQLIATVKRIVLDTFFKGQGANSMESFSVTPPPPTAQETGGIISPYHLFTTLIASTASTFTHTPVNENVPTPTVSSAEKLNRSDSHDSLQSYVNVKSADDAAAAANKTHQQQQQQQQQQQKPSWSGYLASYVWNSQSSVPTLKTTGTTPSPPVVPPHSVSTTESNTATSVQDAKKQD